MRLNRRSMLGFLSGVPFLNKLAPTAKARPLVDQPCLPPQSLVLIPVKGVYRQASDHWHEPLLRLVFQRRPKMEMMVTTNHSFLTARRGYVTADQLRKGDKIWISIEVLIADGSLYKEKQ